MDDALKADMLQYELWINHLMAIQDRLKETIPYEYSYHEEELSVVAEDSFLYDRRDD